MRRHPDNEKTPPLRAGVSEIELAGEIVKTKCTAPVHQTICEYVCTGRDDCVICPNRGAR